MSIQDQIRAALVKAPLPVSVEYLASELGVGWGTALRYCLELLAAGQIQGMKTMKSWVFWTEKEGKP